MKKARSSVGAFYARFSDKNALFQALHERFARESVATAEATLRPERWEGVPLEEIFRQIADFLVEHYRERRGLGRALLIRAAVDALVRDRNDSVSAQVCRMLAALLAARREEIGSDDIEATAYFLHRMTFAILEYRLLFRHPAPPGAVEKAHVRRELERAMLAYLRAP